MEILAKDTGFEVLTSMAMKSSVFWDKATYSLMKINLSEEHVSSVSMIKEETNTKYLGKSVLLDNCCRLLGVIRRFGKLVSSIFIVEDKHEAVSKVCSAC